MKAVLYHRSGGPEVLEYTDVADPEPGARDVIVAVAATALNHLDIVQRNGWFTMPGFRFPHIAGMDLAGTVQSIGTEVEGFAVGDRVVVDPSLVGVPVGSKLAGGGDIHGELYIIGATVDGGYADLCLVPESHVHHVPPSITLEEAATFPTCYLTVWHALFEIGELEAGETGHDPCRRFGYGRRRHPAREAARRNGDRHRGHRREVRASLGDRLRFRLQQPDNRCGRPSPREVTDGRGVDMVFDHIGPALFEASFYSLALRGRFVTCGNTSGDQFTVPSIGHMYHSGIRILGSDPYRSDEFAPGVERVLRRPFRRGHRQRVPTCRSRCRATEDADVELLRQDPAAALTSWPTARIPS